MISRHVLESRPVYPMPITVGRRCLSTTGPSPVHHPARSHVAPGRKPIVPPEIETAKLSNFAKKCTGLAARSRFSKPLKPDRPPYPLVKTYREMSVAFPLGLHIQLIRNRRPPRPICPPSPQGFDAVGGADEVVSSSTPFWELIPAEGLPGDTRRGSSIAKGTRPRVVDVPLSRVRGGIIRPGVLLVANTLSWPMSLLGQNQPVSRKYFDPSKILGNSFAVGKSTG